jgi:hypothetical protein
VPKPSPTPTFLLRYRLLAEVHGFEGFVWLVEPLEAHCPPVADGADGAVPALDLNGACAPVSPHAARLGTPSPLASEVCLPDGRQ